MRTRDETQPAVENGRLDVWVRYQGSLDVDVEYRRFRRID